MIVISRSLLLSETTPAPLDTPIILWNSVASAANLTVSSALDEYPASNLVTDSTIEIWRATTAGPVVIEVATAGEEVDAVGFARHNFGSTHATLTLEAEVDVAGDLEWVELTAPQMLSDNSPVLFRFEPTSASRIRITIEGGAAAPSAAVLYVGKLLVMPIGISAGHVPLDQSRQTQIANGVSEAGHFLGRIITGQSARTSASFGLLPIDWYYAEMEDFVARGRTGPFFFAWLPMDRPQDVGFSWLTSDVRPNMGSMYFDLSLEYGGITW